MAKISVGSATNVRRNEMSERDRIREETIKECIAYLEARPGRKAIVSLKGMLSGIEEAKGRKKHTADHVWRRTIKL